MRIDITSTAFARENGEENLQNCIDACKKYGYELGIQLHNTVKDETIEFFANKNLPLTVHAPICGDYSLNLSTNDNLETIYNAFAQNYEKIQKLGANLSVFHGFVMSDQLIGSMKCQEDYVKNLIILNREDLANGKGSPINGDFTKLPEYAERFQSLKNNLKVVRERFPNVTFCIENDLPIFGYGGMQISKMVELEHPLCLDFSHLWGSALAIDFDFYKDMEIALASGLCKMIHVHNSKMSSSTPKHLIRDGHLSLTENYELDLQRSFKLLKKYNIDYLVLEISECQAVDIDMVAKLYE